jgi:outer membrane receptor for monomeric catechols
MQPTSLYEQDDVTLTPKMTVNLGLRWDYYPPDREVLNRSSFLNPHGDKSGHRKPWRAAVCRQRLNTDLLQLLHTHQLLV